VPLHCWHLVHSGPNASFVAWHAASFPVQPDTILIFWSLSGFQNTQRSIVLVHLPRSSRRAAGDENTPKMVWRVWRDRSVYCIGRCGEMAWLVAREPDASGARGPAAHSTVAAWVASHASCGFRVSCTSLWLDSLSRWLMNRRPAVASLSWTVS
jgi:hypothetical protein